MNILVRMVAWVGEETGGAGAQAYFATHKHDKHVFAMESDIGVFTPWGISFAGSREAGRRLIEIGQKYLSSASAGNVQEVSDGIFQYFAFNNMK